jgi:Tfp pilus assembly protein PilN
LPFQTSLGIDIGSGFVSVVCLKTTFKGVKMAAHAIYPVERDKAAEEQAEVVRGLVQDFLGKRRISPTGIFLGIPREKAIFRYVELPLAVKENLRDTLTYEMEKYVPFPADRAYFDFQVMTEDKENGKMRLLLVVVKRESIDPYITLADRPGNWISGIEIRSTALANFFWSRFKTADADSAAFAYLNGRHMELGLLMGGLLTYSRAVDLPEGGGDVDARISGEVEALREVSGRQGPLEMMCCYPEADLPYADVFKRQEGIEVRRVDLSGIEIPSIAMIPAYGLALKGFQKGGMDINLLPLKLRKKANKAGYYAMVALVGLVVLSGFLWGGSAFLQQRLYLKQLDGEISRLEAEVKQIDRIKSERSRLEERIGYLSRLFGSGVSPLFILNELSERIPDSAWVSGLTLSEKGVEIEGEAGSASELIPLLEASALFYDVTFLSTITKSREGKERFRIGLKVRGLG